MEINNLTVIELVKKGDITIEHIVTEDMIVDPLRDFDLMFSRNIRHVDNVGLVESFNVPG